MARRDVRLILYRMSKIPDGPDQKGHIGFRSRPAGAEPDADAAVGEFLPYLEAEVLLQSLRLGLRQDGEDLVGGAVYEEVEVLGFEGFAYAGGLEDGAARGVHGIKFKLEGDYVIGMEVVATGLPPVVETISDADVDQDAVEDAAALEGAEAAEIEEAEAAEEEAAAEEAEEAAQEGAADADEAIPEDDARPQLLVVTSSGVGKRSYVDTYRLTGRGAMGVRNIKLGEGETVVAAIKVHPGEDIILTTQRGQIVRTRVDEIRLVGRNSMGVRIIALRKNDSIIGVSTVMEVEEEEPKEDAENTGVFAAAGEPLPVREDAEDEPEEAVEETGGDDDFDDDAPKKQSEEEDDYVDPSDFGGGDDGGVPF